MKTHLVICVALLSLATAGLMQLARLWLEQLPPDSLWQVPVAVLPLLPLLTVACGWKGAGSCASTSYSGACT